VAAATGRGLDAGQVTDAMGHAMSTSGGLWQCRNEPVATKHLHVAEAARRGEAAARYAQAGLSGPKLIFEGPQGFFAGLAPDGDPARMVATPDAPWLLHETSFKPWPACRHAHPAIDAALAVRKQLDGRKPTTIRIETFADSVLFCDKPDPRTDAEARFSLQHSVAVALRDGPPQLAAFDVPALPGYADLRALAEVNESADFTARYPAHFGARVTVTLEHGDKIAATVSDAWGDSENPMAAADILTKFQTLTAWAGVARAEVQELHAATMALAEDAPVANLRTALARAAASISKGRPE